MSTLTHARRSSRREAAFAVVVVVYIGLQVYTGGDNYRRSSIMESKL
ncbi:MAG: hypothetical protein M3Q29_14255 [Chloroflexota bacterium]|nr:hypothetical protein [Chloroflexota bacterium]